MSVREIVFLVCVAAAMAAGVAIAPTSRRDGGEGARPLDWGKVTDDRSGRMELSWMGVPVYAGAKKGTWIERMVEERFRVRLEPMLMGVESYNERRSLMFASGRECDVVWDGDPLGFRANVHHELALEVPLEVIVREAPTYVRLLNEHAPKAWLYSWCDGRNYGIPTWASSDVFPPLMVWRMDWLRNVGIDKVPDTLEEMEEALRRFRHNDPDRDGDPGGEPNTYGYCPGLHYSITFIEVYAAFNTLPQDWVVRNGKVAWGGVVPEAKAALRLLRRWYKEGLIDPDYITATGSEPLDQRKFLNGETGFLPYAGDEHAIDPDYPNSLYANLKELNAKQNQKRREKHLGYSTAELVAAPPPRGVADPGNPCLDGKRRYRVWGGPAHTIWFGRHVRKTPEKVLRVLHMFEEFSKPENAQLFVESRIGKRGLHWEMPRRFWPFQVVARDGKADIRWIWRDSRGLVPLPPYDQAGADARELMGISWIDNAYGFYSFCSVPLSVTDPYMSESVKSVRRQFRKSEWGLMNAIGKSDVVPSANRYLGDLRAYQSEVYAEIISGQKPLEYFDTFVAEWNRRGGAVLTREANEVYRTLEEILVKVGGAPVGPGRAP